MALYCIKLSDKSVNQDPICQQFARMQNIGFVEHHFMKFQSNLQPILILFWSEKRKTGISIKLPPFALERLRIFPNHIEAWLKQKCTEKCKNFPLCPHHLTFVFCFA